VDVVDPYTVNVVTKTPFPLLPVRMSPGHCGTVGIVPPKYVAQVGDAGFAVKPVGTGPYRLVEWVKDERLVLDANKDYHRGAPAIERLVFRPVPELTTRVAALLSGQADLVSDVPPDQEAFGFNPASKWWGYDPERAKALLREAGYANGFELTLHAPNRRYMNDIEVMQAMAAMLGKVGIKATVQVWEQSVYTTKWR